MYVYSFLHRVAIYAKRPQTANKMKNQEAIPTTSSVNPAVRGSSARCPSCSGRSVKRNQVKTLFSA